MNSIPPVPPKQRSGAVLIAVGIAFIAIATTNHNMRAFIGVGVVFIIIGVRRNRAGNEA